MQTHNVNYLMDALNYFDYINQISKEDLYKGLLGYGMFSEKLPPIFTSETLYNIRKKISISSFSKSPTDYIRYDSMRNTNVPRSLSIPTPFSYMRLCNCLMENWSKIQDVFKESTKGQKFKCSQIHIQKLKGKDCIFEMSHQYSDRDTSLEEIKYKLPILKQYRIDADISTCFPSIYTHALTWALVGKSEAKAQKGNNKVWFNQLDIFCRNTKNGETNGLLIGPHTSNLLSEIILCQVDKELVGKNYNFIRYIDDYVCYVETYEDAEKFILDLSNALKLYELNINVKKTKIHKLPLMFDTEWVCKLNEFHKDIVTVGINEHFFKLTSLKNYINIAIRLANETGDSAVYTYIIKDISNYKLGDRAKSFYIYTIHHLLLLYPYLVHWIDKYIFDVYNYNKDIIAKIANDLYRIGIKKKNYEACSFALYWSIKYKFRINDEFPEQSILSEDCIFLLLSYLKSKNECDKNSMNLLKTHALSLKDDIDKYWLFVYEILSEDDLTGDYKCIKKKKVSFIKEDYK